MVGGCVRDLLMGGKPKDWDVTTSARPEQVQEIFSDIKTVCENDFGTVTVLNIPPESKDRVTRETPDLDGQVQVTTYRSEGKYSDLRRPDNVTYETRLEKDLERRDFTVNAIAYDPIKDIIKDIFDGIKDIKDKTLRCVLNPTDRFQEDALRILRAVRFSTKLGFAIESDTFAALTKQKSGLEAISSERIRDEFSKIIASDKPSVGVSLLQKTELLQYVLPELLPAVGCEQKGAHLYDVFDHTLFALQHAADKGLSFDVRLSALLHDIGKPATRRYDRARDKYTFYGHEVVGARIAKKVLERLHFSRETVARVTTLVRYHMFFSDTEQITLSAVRRIIRNVGKENIWLLMEVRECDRAGMKKAEAPYRLRKYHAMIEEALRDPISVGQLTIDGKYLMEELYMKPGPRMGWILHTLLEEVLEDPSLNTVEKLSGRAKDLSKQDDETLKKLGKQGKEKKEEVNKEEVGKLRGKHRVQ